MSCSPPALCSVIPLSIINAAAKPTTVVSKSKKWKQTVSAQMYSGWGVEEVAATWPSFSAAEFTDRKMTRLFRNQLSSCSAAAATMWHWQHLKRLMADMSLRCAAWITHTQMCLHAQSHTQDTTWGLRSCRPKQSPDTEGRQHQSFSPFLDNTSRSGPVWEPV